MRTIFGREPAIFWAMVAAVLQGVSLLFGLEPEVQGLVNAALVAPAGFATAAMVSVDAALPALVGLIKAVLALVIGFGIGIPDTTQVAIMAVVTGVAAFWVRAQVVAPIPAVASRPVGAHAPFQPGGGACPFPTRWGPVRDPLAEHATAMTDEQWIRRLHGWNQLRGR